MGFEDEHDEEYLEGHGFRIKVDKKITIEVNRDLHKKLKIISSAKGLSLDKTISLLVEDKLKSVDVVKIVEDSLKSEINDKNELINQRKKEFLEIEENLRNLEHEKKEEIKRANIKEAKLKDDINNINEELEKIKDGTIPAQASKTFELKKTCEEVEELKKKNNQLRETLYLLSRRLYTLEVRNIYFIYFFYLE